MDQDGKLLESRRGTLKMSDKCDYIGEMVYLNVEVTAETDKNSHTDPNRKMWVPHGQGDMTCNDGETYSGDWRFGLFEGKGQWGQGETRYQGGFHENQFSGKGELFHRMEDGTSLCYYIGGFKDHMLHGIGEQACVQEGHFKGVDALLNSLATRKGAEINFQMGHYTNNYLKGFSRMSFETKDILICEIDKSTQNGRALYTFTEDNSKQIFSFEMGAQTGKAFGIYLDKTMSAEYIEGKQQGDWKEAGGLDIFDGEWDNVMKRVEAIEKEVDAEQKITFTNYKLLPKEEETNA